MIDSDDNRTHTVSGSADERTCVIFDVSRDANKNYVERQSLNNKLDEFLRPKIPGCSDARAALVGLGGCGKSELATKFAQKYRDCYSHVFWISATDSAQLLRGLEHISMLLGLGTTTGSEVPSLEEMVQLAQQWLVNDIGWLLIIDNVDEESVLEQLTGSILTAGMRGTILITARNEALKVSWNTVEVSDMTIEEALDLLNAIMGSDYSKDAAGPLLKGLGYFALAIDQAASFMSATGISVEEYHDLFNEERESLLEKYPSTQYNVNGRQSVMTTWEISYQKIEQQHPDAAKLLLLLSLLRHENLSIEFLQSCSSGGITNEIEGDCSLVPELNRWLPDCMRATLREKMAFGEAMATLKKYSFVRVVPERLVLRMHPLVHFWAAEQRLRSDEGLKVALIQCVLVLMGGALDKRISTTVESHRGLETGKSDYRPLKAALLLQCQHNRKVLGDVVRLVHMMHTDTGNRTPPMPCLFNYLLLRGDRLADIGIAQVTGLLQNIDDQKAFKYYRYDFKWALEWARRSLAMEKDWLKLLSFGAIKRCADSQCPLCKECQDNYIHWLW